MYGHAEEVITATAAVYSIPREEIKGERKFQTLAEARHVAMMISRDMTKMSWAELGFVFKRTPWTVRHGVRKAAKLMLEVPLTRQRVRAIHKRLVGE